jgi:hypothetical protein
MFHDPKFAAVGSVRSEIREERTFDGPSTSTPLLLGMAMPSVRKFFRLARIALSTYEVVPRTGASPARH